MDTTQIVLILMPLAIGLQTFWIAHAINGLRGDVNVLRGDVNVLRGDVNNLRDDVNIMRGDVNNLRGDVNIMRGDVNNLRGDINNLRGELHAHELGCQKRSQMTEVRLDRLERVPTEIPHP